MSFKVKIPGKFIDPKFVSLVTRDLMEDHKSTWESDSKGGEPNHRPEQPVDLL